MTHIDVNNPQAEARILAFARQQGIGLAAVVEKLALDYLPATQVEDPTLALFAQWEKEDDLLSEEERAKNDKVYAKIEKNGIPRVRI